MRTYLTEIEGDDALRQHIEQATAASDRRGLALTAAGITVMGAVGVCCW